MKLATAPRMPRILTTIFLPKSVSALLTSANLSPTVLNIAPKTGDKFFLLVIEVLSGDSGSSAALSLGTRADILFRPALFLLRTGVFILKH